MTTTHFALMTIVGIFIAENLQLIEFIQYYFQGTIINPVIWELFSKNIGNFFLSVFAIIFVWQYAVMINHVYDIQIDEYSNKGRLLPSGLLKPEKVKLIAFTYAIIAAGLGLSLGYISFILVAIGLFFGTIYSVPPIRIRDSAFSTIIIGIGSTIAFYLGYFTPSNGDLGVLEISRAVTITYPTLSIESIIIGIIIFIGLTLGPLIKDYKDYEGDKIAGVKNLFTLYGLQKGIKITSILLPLPFLFLLILFNNNIDILILAPLGFLTGVFFYKLHDTRLVFGLYFPVIFYCLLRWFDIIQFTQISI